MKKILFSFVMIGCFCLNERNVIACSSSVPHHLSTEVIEGILPEMPASLSNLIVSYVHPNLYPRNRKITKLYNRALRDRMYGDVDAQLILADIYSTRNNDRRYGVKPNWEEALFWYKLAADRGNVTAQLLLGQHYSERPGIANHNFEAAEWFRKATLGGHSLAKLALGQCYLHGFGVAKDEAKGIGMFYDVAMNDKESEYRMRAQRELGLCFWKGIGVPKNEDVALQWVLRDPGGPLPPSLISWNDAPPLALLEFLERAGVSGGYPWGRARELGLVGDNRRFMQTQSPPPMAMEAMNAAFVMSAI